MTGRLQSGSCLTWPDSESCTSAPWTPVFARRAFVDQVRTVTGPVSLLGANRAKGGELTVAAVTVHVSSPFYTSCQL